MKNWGRLSTVLCALAILYFTTAHGAVAQSRKPIKIGTGGSTGVYFVAGNAICRMLRLNNRAEGAPRLRCAAPPSGGSIENLDMLRAGKVDFAVVQSDWQHHAFNATSRFKSNPYPELRAMFSLHVEPFQIVAAAGSGIKSWSDLDGRRINIGNVGSGHRATFEDLLSIHGQSLSRFAFVSELGSSAQAAALCDGEIDAFAFTVGVPNASIAQATDGCDGEIISLQTPEVGALIKKAPYYSWTEIPEGTYFTSTNSIKTIGVLATLVTRSNVDDETVYQLTKSVFDNFEKFRRLHPAFANLNKFDMARVGMSAPIHDGTLRYYREKKLLKK